MLAGMFDDPASNPYAQIGADVLSCSAHTTLAREAARQSIVLLENSVGLLPLNPQQAYKIAAIGPNANKYGYLH